LISKTGKKQPSVEGTLDGSILREQSFNPDIKDRSQEATWVKASQGGDSLAFNRLVLKWEKSIYNLTMRMLRDPEEAAEATQEVFLSAYKNIRRFRQDARFSTWLYRIAANHCVSRLRRRPQGIYMSLDDEKQASSARRILPVKDSHEGELLKRESRNQVLLALEHLSPEQKVVVELKFFQELTFEQIAEATQLPMSTVKTRLYAGLETLKVRLGRIESC
jgi:RNA polymerase sigma-70 factor (ECF subfamily)